MEQLRVYLDASVIGGYFDDEFSQSTRQLMEHVRKGNVQPVVSDLLAAEIQGAPAVVREFYYTLLADGAEGLATSTEAAQLQDAYLEAGVVTQKWADDALHVALASISKVDVLASWNFKHMIDPRKSRAFNKVNIDKGYGIIQISTPTEIVQYLENG